MLDSTGTRQLAYLVKIDDITAMNADRLECAHIGGWHCVVGKDEFKIGDIAVYFETDSQLPDVAPFSDMAFLASKHFKIKIQKIRGEYSNGLLVPISAFGWEMSEDGVVTGNRHIDDDSRFVTQELGVTYAVTEDNARKAKSADKYKAMSQRHVKLAKTNWWHWLMRREWGKKLLFVFFGRKKDKKNGWPSHIAAKTDVERIQNMMWILNDKHPFVASEKVDGSSCSIMAERNKFGKIKKYICSRNVVFDNPKAECYYDTNIYFEAYEKYDLGNKIERMLEDLNLPNLAIQMEIYGSNVQKRNYSLKEGERRIAVFHILSNNVKMPMDKVVELCEKYELPHVPILDDNYILPDTLEELQSYVEAEMSKIDGLEKEGIVFYDKETGQQYFKFVSPNFLMKYHQ